jgi:hypothetical protein
MLTGIGVRVLGESRAFLGDSSGSPKLSRRDTDDPLEVKAELALVREADA